MSRAERRKKNPPQASRDTFVFSLALFQGARAVAYADDGYIKGKLSEALQVLAELKRVLKEDAGLELNISKTAILPKDITQQAIFDVAHGFINATPQLTQLRGEVSLDSFRPDGFVGIGVPIGTDTFVRQFVAKTCRDIIEDVEKLDAIEDGFIHFQLLRFCQATRLQFLNSHILLDNRCVLQQQHVDCKIADALLKKGTKQHAAGWDASSKDWAHMVLHLPHAEGGLVCLLTSLLKMLLFILLLHALCPGWVLSLRHLRSCGCLKMIFGTRPHGHNPSLCHFVTVTPS